MPKPSETPRWADLAAAEDIAEPADTAKDSGWKARIRPPHEWVNWWWNLVYQWITWLSTTYPTYDTPEDAYADLDDGEAAFVYEADRDKQVGFAGASHSSTGTASTACNALAVSGTHLFYAEGGGNPKMVPRSDIDTVTRTFTKTNAGTVQRLLFCHSEGVQYLVAAYSTYVECWNASTGASLWVYDHGATVYDLAYLHNRLGIAGDTGTGSKEVRALLISSGVAQWSYQHNATAYSICSCGNAFVIAGNNSAHASGANMRALYFSNGADAANEGGTSADTNGVAWDKVQTNQSLDVHLVGDRKGLYWLDRVASTVNRLDPTNGDVLVSWAFDGSWDSQRLALDHEFLLAAIDEGGLTTGWCYALDRTNLVPVWRWQGPTGDPVRHVATDGSAVFVGVENTPSLPVWRLYRGNRPHLFRKTTLGGFGTELYEIPAHLITPEG